MNNTKVCEYDCEFHKGKVEYHHPIDGEWKGGIYLCEAHHSLLKDRKKRYTGEMMIDKKLETMRKEIESLVHAGVLKAGFSLSQINKK